MLTFLAKKKETAEIIEIVEVNNFDEVTKQIVQYISDLLLSKEDKEMGERINKFAINIHLLNQFIIAKRNGREILFEKTAQEQRQENQNKLKEELLRKHGHKLGEKYADKKNGTNN